MVYLNYKVTIFTNYFLQQYLPPPKVPYIILIYNNKEILSKELYVLIIKKEKIKLVTSNNVTKS